jgi:hypothetical protein
MAEVAEVGEMEEMEEVGMNTLSAARFCPFLPVDNHVDNHVALPTRHARHAPHAWHARSLSILPDPYKVTVSDLVRHTEFTRGIPGVRWSQMLMQTDFLFACWDMV